MREMREQPIDPQAEQEIINSIQEVYYSNDSFDMVQHELEVSQLVRPTVHYRPRGHNKLEVSQ
jgi:ABC-type arginine transport system ATPase subunit